MSERRKELLKASAIVLSEGFHSCIHFTKKRSVEIRCGTHENGEASAHKRRERDVFKENFSSLAAVQNIIYAMKIKFLSETCCEVAKGVAYLPVRCLHLEHKKGEITV